MSLTGYIVAMIGGCALAYVGAVAAAWAVETFQRWIKG